MLTADRLTTTPAISVAAAAAGRRRLADRIFTGALLFNAGLTLFWIVLLATGGTTMFFREHTLTLGSLGRVVLGVGIFYVLWGFIWWGIKTALLKYFVGFSDDDRRRAFSSRMTGDGYDVAALVERYSERRIRIVDMIGRRGRFITLASAGFFYLYYHVAAAPTPDFATLFLAENLADAIVIGWIFLGFYYANGRLAAAFYGPQSRVMDGVLARANCLLITTLWTAFKFVMVAARVVARGRVSSRAVRRPLRAHLGLLHRGRCPGRDRRFPLREADTPRVGRGRRQPQVDRGHRDRLRGVAGALHRRGARPRPAGVVAGTGPRDLGVQHAAGAVLPPRHGRLHDGHLQCSDLLRVRAADGGVTSVVLRSPDHGRLGQEVRSAQLIRPVCGGGVWGAAWVCERRSCCFSRALILPIVSPFGTSSSAGFGNLTGCAGSRNRELVSRYHIWYNCL